VSGDVQAALTQARQDLEEERQKSAYYVRLAAKQRRALEALRDVDQMYACKESEAKAEALREAADDYYSDIGPDHRLSTATWLRERADRIEKRQAS
jgi:hypothetical protein